MLTPSTRLEAFRGANVLVRTDRHGNDVVSLWSNRGTKEVMFTNRHAGATAQPLDGQGWVPSTTVLPLSVAPRPGCEDGVVATLDQLMDLFHPGLRVLC